MLSVGALPQSPLLVTALPPSFLLPYSSTLALHLPTVWFFACVLWSNQVVQHELGEVTVVTVFAHWERSNTAFWTMLANPGNWTGSPSNLQVGKLLMICPDLKAAWLWLMRIPLQSPWCSQFAFQFCFWLHSTYFPNDNLQPTSLTHS